MKGVIYIVFFLFSIVNCHGMQLTEINKAIDSSQKHLIKTSESDLAKSLSDNLEMQIIFREKYIPIIDSILKKYPDKPLLIQESYDFVCHNCPADNVEIFNGEVFISLSLNFDNKDTFDDIKYEKQINRSYSKKDNVHLYSKIENDEWRDNSKQYVFESCSDGDLTIYSLYYLMNEIQSLFTRCWTPN